MVACTLLQTKNLFEEDIMQCNCVFYFKKHVLTCSTIIRSLTHWQQCYKHCFLTRGGLANLIIASATPVFSLVWFYNEI